MTNTQRTFDVFSRYYPSQKRFALYQELGVKWPNLIDDANYQNTCSVRLSIAMRKSGVVIPKKFREAIDGEGNAIILKVKTMGLFIESLLGKPYWGMSKPVGGKISAKDIPRAEGILIYHANWSDASGHIDLWDGSTFVGAGNFDDIQDGFQIGLWRVW